MHLEVDGMKEQYKEMEKRLFALYTQKNFTGAYEVAEKMLKDYPSRAGVVYNYAYTMKNLMGDSLGAVQLMEEAAEKGYWADPHQLERDPDFSNLLDDPRFKAVLRKYSNLAEKSRKTQKPILVTLEPEKGTFDNSRKMPIVIALHGNTETVDDSMDKWKFMAEKGWIVALPQSSQISMPNAYVWNDFTVAKEEIKSHYKTLKGKYPIDEDKVLIAGFSKGGALAATLCFEQVIPCRRFVLMGPYLQNPSELEEKIVRFSSGEGKGYLIVGENDVDCINGTRDLFNLLKRNNIQCRIDIVPNLAHEYPSDFQEMFEENMEFLVGDLS